MKLLFKILFSFWKVKSIIIGFAFFLLGNTLLFAAQPYSYSNYLAIPTAMNTPQWCPSDAPITYEMNQPTNYALPTQNTACGYPPNTYDPNYYAAIDSDSFGDTGASGGNGAGGGGFPCGACAALYNSATSKTVTVMIVDECPQGGNNANNCWVGSYHLDLSLSAYNGLLNGGSFPSNSGTNTLSGSTVTWRFVQCPLTGNAGVNVDNASSNIAYEWGTNSKSTYSPLMFLDNIFPIKSVTVNGNSVTRDSSNQNPNFWGGLSGYPSSSTCVLTSYETSVPAVTISVNGYTPAQSAPPGTTSGQFTGCVVGPTSTPTHTPTVGSPTGTPTHTLTVTPTPTLTPLSGCPFYYYSGTSPHALADFKTSTGVNGSSSSLAESTAAALNGETDGLNFQAAVSAGGYYAGMNLNWANYGASPSSPYQPLVNLANYSSLQFYIENTTAAESPMTLTVDLADYEGGAAYTSKSVTFVVTGTGPTVETFPLSDFSTGGASYTTTNIGEIDILVQPSAAMQSINLYVGSIAFYGTCPTSTFTPTKTATNTPTSAFTSTFTPTQTPIPGCEYMYYNGTSPHAMANGVTGISAGGTATVAENATAALNGYTNGMDFQASVTALGYYAQLRWNWAGSNASPGPPDQPLINLNNFTTLEFYIENATAADSPMTLTVTLDDYSGAQPSAGVTESSAPVTIVLTGTGSNRIDLPASDFAASVAGAGNDYTITNIGEIDFEWLASAAAQTAAIYIDGIGFYGTCPTNTPTSTSSFTATKTYTVTPTNTATTTPTSTSTNTKTVTTTPTVTPSNTPNSTSTSTGTSTATNTITTTATPTKTYTTTSTSTPSQTNTVGNTSTNTPTDSPTQTSTNTSTRTATGTSTETLTATITPTPTQTSTGPTSTATVTSTKTDTASATTTATSSSTTGAATSTSTATNTTSDTPTRTVTATNTVTRTVTETPTATTGAATSTSTASSTSTNTFTATVTSTPTQTSTGSIPPTNTPTVTSSKTDTATASVTPTDTLTPMPTSTPTNTATNTATSTHTNSPTASFTTTPPDTPTNTATSTATRTSTSTGTVTNTSTYTETGTPTSTSSNTDSPTITDTATFTPTGTVTPPAFTSTPTKTDTNTVTSSATPTNTTTTTNSPTLTYTSTETETSTPTTSNTPTNTTTATPTVTLKDTATQTATSTITPADTVTNTATSTQTDTATNSATNTETTTPSNTATPTTTATPTNTPIDTSTSTSTPTNSPTITPTSTSTEVTVIATSGSGAPGPSTQIPGASSVTVLQVQLTNPGNTVVTLSNLIIQNVTTNSTTGITSVSLVDNGTIISTANFNGGSTATFVLNNNNTIQPMGGTVTYQVVVNFSTSAQIGNYQFNVIGGAGNNGQSVGFSGLPVSGASISISDATPTPSSTPVSTATPTQSPTPTPLLTTIVSLPYPNPANGPVSVTIQVPGPSTVNMDVFTAAFRKIFSLPPVQVTGSKTLGWDLRDNWGYPVADGLYYIRISVSGIQPTVKILKVLVIR